MAGPKYTPAQQIGVAQGSNRVNSGGIALPSVANRSSRFYNNVVLPGQTLPVPCTGTQFYLTVAGAPLFIRPTNGSFNEYFQGTGLQLTLENAFDLLEVRNENPFSVVFQLFVGFDEFIDNRVFLNTTQTPNVVFPTYDTPSSATAVAIDDISGTQFNDINGNPWFAIARIAIIVSNTDAGVNLLLQESGSAVANGPAIAAIPPLTSIRIDASGDYSLSVGGGNINAIVSEIYQALAAV